MYYCACSVSLDARVLAGLGEFPVESNEKAMKRMGNYGNTMASRAMDVGQMPNWFTQVFISLVTLRLGYVYVKVRVLGLGLVVGLGLALIIHTCRANLVLRVIWHCDVFGMTP